MSHPIVSTPRQADFLALPQTPLCYWLRERFFELLAGRTLGEVADVCQGLATADDDRFVRFVWEVRPEEWARPLRGRRWVPFEKGGGYGKWFGHHWWVVDWERDGARIKATPNPRVQNEQYYFREGWTYSYMARGSLGLRAQGGSIFAHKSPAILAGEQEEAAGIGAIGNCRFAGHVVRAISATIQLPEGCVACVPLPERIPHVLAGYEAACVALKRWLVARDPTERTFGPSPLPLSREAGEGWPPGRGEGRILRRESSLEIRELARLLRRAGNRAEDALWEALRDRRFLGLKFRRQHPLGPFIVDFYCPALRLAVEVDGGVHGLPEVQARDAARDEWLAQRGIRIVRIPAETVLVSPEEALAMLADAANTPSPPAPLPQAGEGWPSGRGEGEPRGEGLLTAWRLATDEAEAVAALLHTLEGLSEREVFAAYRLDEEDIQAVLDETGTPAGWYPLVAGYDALPPLPDGLSVPGELTAQLSTLERRALTSAELTRLKARLRALYQAGPGAKAENETWNGDDSPLPSGGRGDGGEGDEEHVALGAHIPIPAETFLEELSQKLEIHPISVYWLLKELREQDGLVSPPLAKQAMEDYLSVTVLRLLGYRWPEEVLIPDPLLPPGGRGARGEGATPLPRAGEGPGVRAVEDGILPLVPCGDQPTALERVRMRLERDFGLEGAEQSEREFRQWVGRSLDDWLRRDFFKRHVQQFKQRPIAWHLVSPERTFEAFVLYHKLSRATLQKLRAQYAGGLIARLRAEQERARQRGATTDVSRLQLQIEDVEEFRARLEKIERGDELKYRIRCRWKGEADTGRAGPYAPDIDDGVKVNIRPFQEAGLLVVNEVIKKW